METNYTLEELLAVEISRRIASDDICGFVGVGTGGKAYIRAVGLPAVATRIAQLRHAPDFTLCFGSIIDTKLDSEDIPETNFEPDLLAWPSRSQISSFDCLSIFKCGRMDIGFISAPQIDKYGNTNVVCIGDYKKPSVRFPGSLAQPDHCAFAKKTYGVFRHDRRTFVEKVDFISGAGHNNRQGLSGGGLTYVFTELGVMDFDPKNGLMRVKSIHPISSVEEIKDNTGFDIQIPENVPFTMAPTEEDLKLIRERIDPKRKWLNAAITQQPATL
ncbi:MAG: CoA-transferase subunit beta [Christensenellales bacterium]